MSKKSKIFRLFLITLLLLLLTTKPLSSSQKDAIVEKYLYTIEKIYFENIFTNNEIYSVKDLKDYFVKKINVKNINEAFKETIYTFIKDPYLEIKDRDIFVVNYYQERKAEDDIKIQVIKLNELKVYYINFVDISPNMARKYKEYLSNELNKTDKEIVIIIDLTNNFGGSLWSAAFFTSLFLEPNTYLFSVNFKKKGKIKTQNFYSSEDYSGYFRKNFIAILQDDTTASSAEVISGVLKRKCLVFGDLTYGKPYIQSVIELDQMIIIYTNGFLNFSLELEPHQKIKPDFYLSRKEIESKSITNLVVKIYIFLRSMLNGG
ncbi:MAG: S41 family peptidase [Candidatus Calescibacterium sp.]|nr:S41 family peptidase [Candidatus Calescibacterium sp.]MDW8133308.1 S41 family peptidase [Candidatus Calescibacterium sp.]